MKEISIVIVSWNALEFLRGCLLSVRESGGSAIREVIVVDNASSDGSADMVAKEFPEVILVRSHENLGFARANNLGLARASGRWLALVNSDVIIHPGCFERLVNALEKDGRVALVGPKVFGADGGLQRTCRRLPTLWNTLCRTLALDSAFRHWSLFSGREMRHWSQKEQSEVEVLSGCFWVARRQAVEEVGGLDARFFFYAEDVDWCKRLRAAGWRVLFVPEATATHFGGGSSANAPLRYSVEMLRANLAYWKKHRGLPGVVAFYVLCVLHHGLRFLLQGLRTVMHLNAGDETVYKCQRSRVCLRWLLSGRGV